MLTGVGGRADLFDVAFALALALAFGMLTGTSGAASSPSWLLTGVALAFGLTIGFSNAEDESESESSLFREAGFFGGSSAFTFGFTAGFASEQSSSSFIWSSPSKMALLGTSFVLAFLFAFGLGFGFGLFASFLDGGVLSLPSS